MKYEEFLDKLDEHRKQFVKARGREPESLDEFVRYVREKLFRRPSGGGVKSLKGFNI